MLCSSCLSLKSRTVCLISGMIENITVVMDRFRILEECQCFTYTCRLLPILWGENGTKTKKNNNHKVNAVFLQVCIVVVCN